MNLIDEIIAIISPGWAVLRARDRQTLRNLQPRPKGASVWQDAPRGRDDQNTGFVPLGEQRIESPYEIQRTPQRRGWLK